MWLEEGGVEGDFGGFEDFGDGAADFGVVGEFVELGFVDVGDFGFGGEVDFGYGGRAVHVEGEAG